MLKRILLGILLSIGISACQSEKEKAYDDLMNDLDDLDDMTTGDEYLSDQESCIEYFVDVIPLYLLCTGEDLDTGIDLYPIAVNECIAMQCDMTNRDVDPYDVSVCSFGFSCDESAAMPDACAKIMQTCVDTGIDADMGTDMGTDTTTE
jgi:hypothetical protein